MERGVVAEMLRRNDPDETSGDAGAGERVRPMTERDG